MENKKKLEGIGGWLLLPVIGLIIGAVISIFVSILSLFLLNNSEFRIYFIGFTIGSFFSVYTLFLIFKKKKEAPKWAILTVWYVAILQVVFALIFPDSEWADLRSGFLLSPIIWTLYFSYSKRVKNTFNK